MTATELVRVTPNGRDQLLVARAIVQGGPYEAVESILVQETEMPGLGAETLRLFEETLALGGAQALARLGGWRRVGRITAEGVKVGRLWEVHHASPLAFSGYAFKLCQWLVTQPLGPGKLAPFNARPTLPGDELVAYLTCALVDGQALARRVAAQPGVRAAALPWLGFPAMLGGASALDDAGAEHLRPRFAALVGDGAVVLEGVSDDLTRRAVAFERAKATVYSPAELLRLGEARERTLALLLDVLERVDRRDLATFLVDAAAQLLPRSLTGTAAAQHLTRELDPAVPLRDRAAAVRASGAHLRQLGRLARYHEVLRHVRHFDEGYTEAQHLLSRWEHLGSDGFSRAAEALTELESLDRG